MDGYVLSIDQSTSAAKAHIIDRSGRSIAGSACAVVQHLPREGWVEQDPEDIWEKTIVAIKDALAAARILPEDIRAIGIANQQCTTVVWRKGTGQAIGLAIGWQDRRTQEICERYSAREKSEIGAINGCGVFPNLSLTKLRWLLEHDRAVQKAMVHDDLLFGTVDTWLIWRLSGGAAHVTDHSNASVTGMLNAASLKWERRILEKFSIPQTILPELKRTSEVLAYTDPRIFFGARIPISACVGDQAAAAFGQILFEPGAMKNTYGTGAFLVRSTGGIHLPSKSNVVTPVLWSRGDTVTYGLEGFADVSGEVVQWLKSSLDFVDDVSEVDGLAMQVPDSGGVYFVPAMVGMRMPIFSPKARGTIFGLNLGSTKQHITRAALESMAYQTRDSLESMEAAYGFSATSLRVDGGSAQSDFLLQFQADILGIPVERPTEIEASTMGAAYLSGLAVGYWDSLEEVAANWRLDMRFEPRISQSRREELYSGWLEAVDLASRWRGGHPVAERTLGPDKLLEALSPREVEVMKLVSSGWSMRDISTRFHTNIKTVEKQRRDAMEKLGADNLASAIRICLDNGLVQERTLHRNPFRRENPAEE
jgi:glycerol kinase